jgi:phenylalanyl-tRNA synthetase beta chain
MKVPIGWLKDYVAIDVTPEVLAEKLTFSGIEVEGIETVGATYEGMVAGEIVALEPHPNADRLRLCSVFDGATTVPVVCGADNFGVGDKAAFAPVGVTLPGGMKIKRAKIRGVESLGMLCAEDELGLSDDHGGILLLPPETAPGTPLVDVVGGPDTVLELEMTWNRPDCLCMIGIAREVAALLGQSLKLPATALPDGEGDVHDRVRVLVDDPENCRRYTARLLEGLRVGPSPMWLRRRLVMSGIRPISNIVDVTNYVMLETGHPLHAFDFTLLEEQTIHVRRAGVGETIVTLDGKARPLNADMLVIADARRPVAVAGIMGGAGSEIGSDTRQVLLESAHFEPARIRRTSSALGLGSESSYRFERGVNPATVEWAGARAAGLMHSLAGGTLVGGVVDVYPRPPDQRAIPLRFERVRSLLGVPVGADEIVGILESIELQCTERQAAGCVVRAPDFRLDLHIEADLIEEVARLYGLDRVPAGIPTASVVADADDAPSRAVYRVRDILAGLGFVETVTYSFVADSLLDLFDSGDRARRVALPNPVSAEHGFLRPALAPQLIETLGHNLARQTAAMHAYEIGRVFQRDPDGAIVEANRLALGCMGRATPAGTLVGRRAVTEDEQFFAIKGSVEALLEAAHVDLTAVTWMPCARAWLAPGQAATIAVDGREVGWIGLLSAAVRRRWRMQEPVGVAELEIACVTDKIFSIKPLHELPAYPSVARDVALVVDAGVSHAQIEAVIRAAAPLELTRLDLFDIFTGEGIGKGRRSLAYSLVYRSRERTLTDAEVNSFHESVREALKRELGADLREG